AGDAVRYSDIAEIAARKAAVANEGDAVGDGIASGPEGAAGQPDRKGNQCSLMKVKQNAGHAAIGRTTGLHVDSSQARAVTECGGADVSDAGGNEDAGQGGSCKCIGSDDGDTPGQREIGQAARGERILSDGDKIGWKCHAGHAAAS